MVGSEFTLTCAISETIPGLTNMPTAMWLDTSDDASGTPVVPGDGITIVTLPPEDRIAVSTLTFNPLKTSHLGQYICSGSITSLGIPRVVSVKNDLSVQSKRIVSMCDVIPCVSPVSPPAVTLSVSSGPLLAGGVEDVILTCSAMVDWTVVDSGAIEYDFTWQDQNGLDLVSGDRITVTNRVYYYYYYFSSTLTLSPLSTTDANFTCLVRASEVNNRVLPSELASTAISLNVIGENYIELHASSPCMVTCTLTIPYISSAC